MKSCVDCGQRFNGSPEEELCPDCLESINKTWDTVNDKVLNLITCNTDLIKIIENQINWLKANGMDFNAKALQLELDAIKGRLMK